MVQIPRVVVAGTCSGVGKTTVATGLMAALAAGGTVVQGYKVGPDYIDPGFHRLACQRQGCNLDGWLLAPAAVRSSFILAAAGADMAVIEGVMGLHDGARNAGNLGSTAQVALLLQAPVILVLDASSLGRSAAAVVLGYRDLEPELQLAGVVLNRVASVSHAQLVQQAVEELTGVPVLGWLPAWENISLPSRHLGLVPVEEQPGAQQWCSLAGQLMRQHLNLKQVLAIAHSAPPMAAILEHQAPVVPLVRLAYAHDAAFSFYYQDSLQQLVQAGAELVPFSPLGAPALPAAIDGLLLGGGFPEEFLEELAANRSLLEQIGRTIKQGLPVYAECGGMLYLARQASDRAGRTFSLVGALPAVVRMQPRLVGMGYRHARLLRDCLLGQAGEEIRGHEFHYSVLEPAILDYPWIYQLSTADGMDRGREGYAWGRVHASYLHLNLAGLPAVAERLVAACVGYRQEREGAIG